MGVTALEGTWAERRARERALKLKAQANKDGNDDPLTMTAARRRALSDRFTYDKARAGLASGEAAKDRKSREIIAGENAGVVPRFSATEAKTPDVVGGRFTSDEAREAHRRTLAQSRKQFEAMEAARRDPTAAPIGGEVSYQLEGMDKPRAMTMTNRPGPTETAARGQLATDAAGARKIRDTPEAPAPDQTPERVEGLRAVMRALGENRTHAQDQEMVDPVRQSWWTQEDYDYVKAYRRKPQLDRGAATMALGENRTHAQDQEMVDLARASRTKQDNDYINARLSEHELNRGAATMAWDAANPRPAPQAAPAPVAPAPAPVAAPQVAQQPVAAPSAAPVAQVAAPQPATQAGAAEREVRVAQTNSINQARYRLQQSLKVIQAELARIGGNEATGADPAEAGVWTGEGAPYEPAPANWTPQGPSPVPAAISGQMVSISPEVPAAAQDYSPEQLEAGRMANRARMTDIFTNPEHTWNQPVAPVGVQPGAPGSPMIDPGKQAGIDAAAAATRKTDTEVGLAITEEQERQDSVLLAKLNNLGGDWLGPQTILPYHSLFGAKWSAARGDVTQFNGIISELQTATANNPAELARQMAIIGQSKFIRDVTETARNASALAVQAPASARWGAGIDEGVHEALKNANAILTSIGQPTFPTE